MKRDAYNFESNWEEWKNNNFNGIKGVRRDDRKILIEYQSVR